MVDRRILLVRLAKADVRCQIFHWRIHDNHSGFRESAWPHELAALCAADSLFGSSGADADVLKPCSARRPEIYFRAPWYDSILHTIGLNEADALGVPNAVVVAASKDCKRCPRVLVFDFESAESIPNHYGLSLIGQNRPKSITLEPHGYTSSALAWFRIFAPGTWLIFLLLVA